MSASSASLVKSVAGPLGTTVGAVLSGNINNLQVSTLVVVVVSSSLTGMAAHQARAPVGMARLALEAGAIMICALWIGLQFANSVVTLAVISMATGMAGNKVLNIAEQVILRLVEGMNALLDGTKK